MENKQEKEISGELVGEIFNFFDKVNVAAVKVKSDLMIGDKIRIVGGEKDFEQEVESMQVHGKSVNEDKKGDDVGIKLVEKARKGYRIYRI